MSLSYASYVLDFSAAITLLEKVKKMFGDPHKTTQDLKDDVMGKVADYKEKFDEAQELLKEAREKIEETDHLYAVNQRNMTALEVHIYFNHSILFLSESFLMLCTSHNPIKYLHFHQFSLVFSHL